MLVQYVNIIHVWRLLVHIIHYCDLTRHKYKVTLHTHTPPLRGGREVVRTTKQDDALSTCTVDTGRPVRYKCLKDVYRYNVKTFETGSSI